MKETRSFPRRRFFSAPLLLPVLLVSSWQGLVSVSASANLQQRQPHHLRHQSRLLTRDDHLDSDTRAAVVIHVQRHDHGIDRQRLPQKIDEYHFSREATEDEGGADAPSPTPELQDTDEEAASPTPTPTANTPDAPAPSATPELNPTPTPIISTPVPIPPPETPVPQPTPAPVTPAPVVQPTVAPSRAAPTPGPTVRTPAPSMLEEQDEVATPAPLEGGGSTGTSASQDNDGIENKVSKPYFTDSSRDYVMTATLHIGCDTEGATIYYTVDGSDPGKGLEGSRKYDAAGKVVVSHIGTHTVKAIGTKGGMHDSDIAVKEFDVQERVATPVLVFQGEVDKYHEGLAYLRNVTVTMDCSTPNATIFYTTDGSSSPTKDSPLRAAPGDQIMWAEEGTTTFTAAAFAFAMFESDVSTWEVTIVAPRLDEHDLAETPAGGAADGMHPQVEVTAFEAVYAPPGAELGQEEILGPGYSECNAGTRIVRGKLLRLLNPRKHFSIVAPTNACGDATDPSSAGTLALASKTATDYEPVRQNATLLDGESPRKARERLGLDDRETAWRAAKELGCQAAAAGGLLGLPGGLAGCVGHVVTGGDVLRADNGTTGMVSFGVRGGKYVVGMVTAEEVLDESNPFQDLISGAGWLVRSGANHVDASARDGHLDILREGWDGKTHGDAIGQGLDDVLSAKLARTALGHDAKGRLILLQTTGAAAGADQDAAIQDGLDLSEFADILVEAGAINAVNLVGGGPAAMTQNHSAIVDPAGDCSSSKSIDSDGEAHDFEFANGSTSSRRCEIPVSSIVCVHLDPPPFVPGAFEEPAATSAPVDDPGDGYGTGGGSRGSTWSSSGGARSDSTWDDDEGGEAGMRTQWTEDLCASNGTGNTTLWQYLDDVEEAVLRYKIAFWVVTVLGMASLYFNIQNHKRHSANGDEGGNGSPYGKSNITNHIGAIGTINGRDGLRSAPVSTGLEMARFGSGGKDGKRGSRSGKGRRHKGSSSGGGYAKLNGDNLDAEGADGSVHAGLTGGVAAINGFYDDDSDQEEVDLGLVRHSRPSSSRKRDKSKGGRSKKALSKVAKGAGREEALPPPRADSDSDATMAINPFVGGGGGLRREGTPGREGHDEAGTWA